MTQRRFDGACDGDTPALSVVSPIRSRDGACQGVVVMIRPDITGACLCLCLCIVVARLVCLAGSFGPDCLLTCRASPPGARPLSQSPCQGQTLAKNLIVRRRTQCIRTPINATNHPSIWLNI